jgi:hypothetical protein
MARRIANIATWASQIKLSIGGNVLVQAAKMHVTGMVIKDVQPQATSKLTFIQPMGGGIQSSRKGLESLQASPQLCGEAIFAYISKKRD